jgi:hypothetical protein
MICGLHYLNCIEFARPQTEKRELKASLHHYFENCRYRSQRDSVGLRNTITFEFSLVLFSLVLSICQQHSSHVGFNIDFDRPIIL